MTARRKAGESDDDDPVLKQSRPSRKESALLEAVLSNTGVLVAVLKFVPLAEAGRALLMVGNRLDGPRRADALKFSVLTSNPSRVLDLRSEWCDDAAAMLLACQADGMLLERATEEIRDSFDVVNAAVSSTSNEVLCFASDRLRANHDIVKAAVTTYGDNLRYAATKFKNDKTLALIAVSREDFGNCLAFVSERLQNDRDVVLAAVKHPYNDDEDGSNPLRHASPELRADREIVLAAVAHSTGALEVASATLRGDHEVVERAVIEDFDALRWASDELRADPEFLLKMMKARIANDPTSSRWEDCDAFECISESLLADASFMRSAVAIMGGGALVYASEELLSDKALALFGLASSERGKCGGGRPLLCHFSDDLRDELAIVTLAIWQNPRNFAYASARHRNNPSLFQEALKSFTEIRGQSFVDFSSFGPGNNFFLTAAGGAITDSAVHVRSAIELLGCRELQAASARVRRDKGICMRVAELDGCLGLGTCDPTRRDDEDVVKTAVRKARTGLQYVSARLRGRSDIAELAIDSAVAAGENWCRTVLPHLDAPMRSLLKRVHQLTAGDFRELASMA